MTPKEKANQLFDDFLDLMDIQHPPNAKYMAIRCVDEILKNFEGLHKPEYCAFDAIGERKFIFKGEYEEHMTGYDMVEYWQEVKKEIEKL